jgi:hypothetical protein
MTDDPRLAEWSRADAPDSSPGMAAMAAARCHDRDQNWSALHQEVRDLYARIASAVVDAAAKLPQPVPDGYERVRISFVARLCYGHVERAAAMDFKACEELLPPKDAGSVEVRCWIEAVVPLPRRTEPEVVQGRVVT